MYLGKIVNVVADESVLSDEGKITLSKFSRSLMILPSMATMPWESVPVMHSRTRTAEIGMN